MRPLIGGLSMAELSLSLSVDLLEPQTNAAVLTMTLANFDHVPVMANEVIDVIETLPPGSFADLTLGGAGHAQRVLDANDALNLHGFDQDPHAIEVSSERLAPYGDRAHIHRQRFDNAVATLRGAGVEELSGFLMDLGVSSPQLDGADRGFSFRLDGPLDMRMDTDRPLTAAVVVNTYSVGELRDVLESYGDERHAARIVHAIVEQRPITTTSQLAEIVENAVPAAVRRKSTTHVATRTFQALRIEVNDELAILGDTIDGLIAILAPGGVGIALTYHSGEDRIVKDRMRLAVAGDAPPGMPVISPFDWAFRGAKTASEAELADNPRARSARMRAIMRKAA